MSGRHEGRVAIVTGGGHNIGRAVAVRLAAEGARVVVAGRRAEPLAETVALIAAAGGEALAITADITERASVAELADRALQAFGPIDVLAAIAGGGGGYHAVDEIDPDWWEHVLRINVVGTFNSVRAVLPGMRARNRGTLVTCTGGGAFFPVMELPATAYATSKAAICRFTDQLAVELWDTGIRVNCLQPGQTWSPERQAEIAAEEARTGAPHPGRATNHPPEDAAEVTAWLASDESAPLSGRTVSVDDDWWRDPACVQAVHASHHAYTLRRVEGG